MSFLTLGMFLLFSTSTSIASLRMLGMSFLHESFAYLSYSTFPQTFTYWSHTIWSCTSWHIDLYLSFCDCFVSTFEGTVGGDCIPQNFCEQVHAQNFMNEQRIGAKMLSPSSPPCAIPPRSQKVLSSAEYTERRVPPRSFNFIIETKQSGICLIKLFFVIVNDFRTQHLPQHFPSYPEVLEIFRKSPERWLSQILHRHKISSFSSGQFFGCCYSTGHVKANWSSL